MRSGADTTLENSKRETPLDLASNASVKAVLTGQLLSDNDDDGSGNVVVAEPALTPEAIESANGDGTRGIPRGNDAVGEQRVVSSELKAKRVPGVRENEANCDILISVPDTGRGASSSASSGGNHGRDRVQGGSAGGGGVEGCGTDGDEAVHSEVREKAVSVAGGTGNGNDIESCNTKEKADEGSRQGAGTGDSGDVRGGADGDDANARRTGGSHKGNDSGGAVGVVSKGGGGGEGEGERRVGSLAERRRKKRKLAAQAGAGAAAVSLSHLDGDGDEVV